MEKKDEIGGIEKIVNRLKEVGNGQLPFQHLNGINNSKCYGTTGGDCPFFVYDPTNDLQKWTIIQDGIISGRRNVDTNGLCTGCLNLCINCKEPKVHYNNLCAKCFNSNNDMFDSQSTCICPDCSSKHSFPCYGTNLFQCPAIKLKEHQSKQSDNICSACRTLVGLLDKQKQTVVRGRGKDFDMVFER